MPGSYPSKMLDTPEKRDVFWNERVGAMLSLVLAFPAFFLGGKLHVILGGAFAVVTFLGGIWLSIRFNIFGPPMNRFVDVFLPEEKKNRR